MTRNMNTISLSPEFFSDLEVIAQDETLFVKLQKYVKKTIKEISKELYDGNIDLKPYFNLKNKKTPCDYCEYKAVCQFDTSLCGNKYNYIGNLDKNLILDMIKESK